MYLFNLILTFNHLLILTDLDHELVSRDSLAGPGLDVEQVDVVLLEDLQGLGQGAHCLSGGEDDVEGPGVLRVLVHDNSALDHARLPNESGFDRTVDTLVLFDELNSRDVARDNNNYQLLRIATGGNSYCHKLEIFRQAKRNIFAKIFGIFDNLEYHGISDKQINGCTIALAI